MEPGTRVIARSTRCPFVKPGELPLKGELIWSTDEIPGGQLHLIAFDPEYRDRLLEKFSAPWGPSGLTETRLILGDRHPDDFPGDERCCLLLYTGEMQVIQ